MHLQILTKNQQELLPLLSDFSSDFCLVGGTAVALQIGHRQSIDFDLFKNNPLDILLIKKTVNKFFPIDRVKIENQNEYTISINKTQITFHHYPFKIKCRRNQNFAIAIPDLLTLAAMKAFALGKRAKWKDYVDLYFIFQQHPFKKVVDKATSIFRGEFSEKLFREQLSYYQDIDYTEKIIYQPNYRVSDRQIKQILTKISLNP